jgi:hypothetical protein
MMVDGDEELPGAASRLPSFWGIYTDSVNIVGQTSLGRSVEEQILR